MNRCSLFILCAAASLTACTTAVFRVDAGSDVGPDAATPDVSLADREDVSARDQIDVVMDDRVAVDSALDAAVDVPVDASTDAALDAVLDASADAAPDAAPDATEDASSDAACVAPFNSALHCGACGRRCVGDATCQDSGGGAFRCISTTCANHSVQLRSQGEVPPSTAQTVRLDPDGLGTDSAFDVTCVDLDGAAAKEYVSVRATDLSGYGVSPTTGGCGDFRMSRGWTRLRLVITPGASPRYAIDAADRVFVTSPSYFENNGVTSVTRFETCTSSTGSTSDPNLAALGSARVCGNNVEGFSNIDLSMTGFRVPRSFLESYQSVFAPTGALPAPNARVDIYEDGWRFVPVVQGYCAELWPTGWDRGTSAAALATRRIPIVRSEREPLLAQRCVDAVQLQQRTPTTTPLDLRFVMSGADPDSPNATTCPLTVPASVRWARVVAAPGQTLRISMSVSGASGTLRVLSDCSATATCLGGARGPTAQVTVTNSDMVNPRGYFVAVGLASGAALNGVRIAAEQM